MPLLANAKKALRVSQHKAAINRSKKSSAKSAIDAVRTNPSTESLSKAYTEIDRAAKQGIFHKNKAARLKSQLAHLLKK